MDKAEFKGIVLRDKEKRLSISRIPSEVKEAFVNLAKEDFCDDFGMCLKFCLEQTKEYQAVKAVFLENISLKLDQILQQINIQNEEKLDAVKTMSGRKVERGYK